jgi:hypothetical protein
MYVLGTLKGENTQLINQITFDSLEDMWEHVNSLCYSDNIINPFSSEMLFHNLMRGKPCVLMLNDHKIIFGENNVVSKHTRRTFIGDQLKN